MSDKHPIHTTLSTEAMRILERHEKELGNKNSVLEKALLGMNKGMPEAVSYDTTISKIKIEFLKGLLGDIAEGTIFGIIGPPASGKTLLACRIIHDFLSSNEKQCVFISKRNQMSYLIPITNSLGMSLGSFAEKLFLNICEMNTLDAIFRTIRKTKPKIIVIDDLRIIQENGNNNLDAILNSSGWNIFSEEVRNQKIICIVTSEDRSILRFCDIAIELEKINDNNNLVIIKVVKNIGIIPSVQYKLEILDSVRIIPLQANVIEIIGATPSEKPENGSYESLEKIANNSIRHQNAPSTKTELIESPKEPIAFRVVARDGTVLFDPEKSDKSADLEIEPVTDIKKLTVAVNMSEPPESPKIVPIVPQAPQAKELIHDAPNFDLQLLEITELLKKRVDEKKVSREERIMYAILKSGGEIILRDLQKETGMDYVNIYGVLKNLTSDDWISDNGQKGKNKIIRANKNKLTSEGLPPRKLCLSEKIIKLLGENNGELRQPEIARRLDLPHSNISLELITMKEKGEIERIGNGGRKGYSIRLTIIEKSAKAGLEEKHRNTPPEAIVPELKKLAGKIEKTAEASLSKTNPRDASPAEIAMKIDMMKRSALNFPNAPTSKSQVVNQSAPLLIEVLLNDFTVESLHIFAEKYKSSGKYDELVAYIASSLPSILKTQEEEKTIQQEQQVYVKPATSGKQSVLFGNKKKIKDALEANGGALNRKQISEKTGILLPNLNGPLRKMEALGIISIDTSNKEHVVSLKIEVI